MGFWEKLEDFGNYMHDEHSRKIRRYGEKLNKRELQHAINHSDGKTKKILEEIYESKF